jgi:hypothetical protein
MGIGPVRGEQDGAARDRGDDRGTGSDRDGVAAPSVSGAQAAYVGRVERLRHGHVAQ